MSKKILGIKASGRIKSNTEILLNELLRPARERGYDIEIISLVKYDLKHCTGCFGCNNGELKCVIKDDLEIIKEKIENADGIALAAPCFAIGAPSILKTIMDRSAVWALDIMANNSKQKYGVAIMVGGADPKWLSLQRTLPAEFLKLYNCKTTGMFTIGNTGLKGEILLKSSEIRKVHDLGTTFINSIETDTLINYEKSEIENRLICPICYSDVFHVNHKNEYTCAVCNTVQKKYVKLEKILKKCHNEENIFSTHGAREHNEYVGNKISQLMQASDEVKKRLDFYFDKGILPADDYDMISGEEIDNNSITWDKDGLAEFERIVPGAFKSFVKKAIEKKALKKSVKIITKEIFLQIKRESGN